MFNPSLLPDITSQHKAEIEKPLQWVGMEEIAIPMLLPVKGGSDHKVNAKSSVYVDLVKDDAKGIHMSRLHLALNQMMAGKLLDRESISTLLQSMVQSQEGISNNARIILQFDLVLEKPALVSGEQGFQSYPVRIDAQKIADELQVKLDLTIPYSSTCPCSASLSRQLYAEEINTRFDEEKISKEELINWVTSGAGTVATPHSQRSYAYMKLSLAKDSLPDFPTLIFQIEKAIGTPVQTAVKRQDEQAFAKLNAQNLMFCEDTARRIKSCLESINFVSDYWFKVEHQESLHAHNAVVIDQKYN